ncbi:MAG: bifunctional [glutamate--ammonia ligase]-adenylyl-L-tyrosine phosphorylase/[glutamate--ammonia-ligase] adenylyltransferase [Candidatus Binatia bacterium]
MDAPDALLHRLGADHERVARLARTLGSAVSGLADRVPALLVAAADPAMALAGWERLLEVTADPAVIATLNAEELSALCVLLGGSQPLSNTLQALGAGWLTLFRECYAARTRTAADHERELRAAIDEPWETFSSQLRQLRHRQYLRIGLADLTGRYPVETTMAELSELAAGLFAAACQWARRTLRDQYDDFPSRSSPDSGLGTPDSFVVLAMGKLGGGELNFSSDVDVMYLYASESQQTGGGPRGTLQAREFFTRLAELVTRALQEVTPSGFAFRVDLRLRPEGVNGPIVNALNDALVYYEAYGQTWERSALIQARPIAGEMELGERFLREMRPFVYRRYLDYATIADMKEMKARVETQLGKKVGRGNVKLGRGGIREIEFLVQVLQLVHGGRDERVRGLGSLPTLAKLTEAGYLPADEGQALVQAYRFLRNVEHKIQIVHQRQTHMVPSDVHEQETLARRLGYRGDDAVAQMWADLTQHTERVRRAFEKLFYEPAAEARRSADAEVVELLQTLEDREASLARLRALGFTRPESGYDDLLLLRDGPVSAPARVRRKQVLYDIAPSLLRTILQSADPDLALRNVATFISSVGARTSFLALLRENPGTLRMLVELFGGSQFLANAFIRHPELLDTLVRADLVRVHRTAEDLAAEVQTLLPRDRDLEESLEALRRFRNQEFLRIGINDLQSVLRPEEVSAELTVLAQVCLQSACDVAARDVCARYGCSELPGQLVVLGLGKLGGGELNYNSDLDLIFVYEEPQSQTTPVPSLEFFSKLAQRLITVLQVATREGIVYRIDTRLRPSGRSGPLVSSLESFRRYHETSAQIWERQALVKARPVAGTPALGQRVAMIISNFVYRACLRAEEVSEIRRLRWRMEHELARESRERLNIKTGRGGLVDVEFLTQMLQLHYGASEASVRGANTLGALEALARASVLSAEDYRLLADGYRFLRRVENSLRLAYDRPVEDLDRTQMDLKRVAKRMGFEGGAEDLGALLWQEFSVRREAIRGCYERWFDRLEAELK